MTLTIRRGIASHIYGRKFTIIVDETTCSNTKEQCVLVLHWVDDKLEPFEDVSGLHDTPAANTINILTLSMMCSFD